MSVFFVSKSVLTAKEGGDGYEEKPIVGQESNAGSTSRFTNSKPLFEQLRANQEQEEAEREEFQKSIMRGTLALDDEDCAHLDAVRKQKQERDNMIQRQTQAELEAFRAAQAVSRIEQGALPEVDEDDEDEKASTKPSAVPPKLATNSKPQFPILVIKKRKKIAEKTEPMEEKKQKQNPADTKSSMVGLLAGYGSDSDSD